MRFTIKLKLGLSFGLVIMLSVAMVALGISSLASLNDRLESLIKGPVHRLEMVLELQLLEELGLAGEFWKACTLDGSMH